MAYYEWKVCNSSEIKNHEFPTLDKEIVLNNYYDQQYTMWETENAITLHQPGGRVYVLFKENAGKVIKYGLNNYLRLEKLKDGTFDVYHGQEG